MAPLTILCVLLVVLVQTLATREIIDVGGEYRRDCSISEKREGYILQFFINKTEVKMFKSRTFSDTLKLVSNGTTIVPTIANYTDRYSVEETDGRYTLIIQNVTDSDSAWYGCRSFDSARNATSISVVFDELLVPGPFGGIFWTTNYTKLSLDTARQHEIPDGGITLIDNVWHSPDIACAVLVSNLEPAVNITIGRFGEPDSVDITDQFETRSSSVVHFFKDGGTTYRGTVFFVKKFKFTQTSLRDVYCRASLFSTTYEKSINIQVTSKPQNKACDPKTVAALVGSKNVNLTCLIEAHPEPYVEWILPGGQQINALSNNPNYTVTNEARFEGLFTTLTISEVTEGNYDFGRIEINATNTEGSGEHYVNFQEGSDVSAAGITRSSASLIAMTTWLLVWMLE